MPSSADLPSARPRRQAGDGVGKDERSLRRADWSAPGPDRPRLRQLAVGQAGLGANPIAAVFPRRVEAPFSIDLLALDREGNSATDPKAGLKGCPWG
jgi:hypothetical protein